ncbi:Glu/Leu/Phe/Val dehydrogenase [Flammeovirgaceae bacterium KN852]|uniref:Glu/Leu/Phe/Val dehydrogenase n=1 Tax=Marinigracilibium pacificum TaxID=2729599 RepID=A0A848IX82_9BACT|nr:Glu/Leu/Phe/Val dehydrogenase [Marinigracilibium pacificum]
MAIFNQMTSMEHEQVVFCYDKPTGLKSIIGIHNTVLGPALGGTRMWNYASDSEALTDVLRLSRGMTFKNALAGLNIGGGKAVIIGDPRQLKNEAFLRRFGRFVESLNGKYVTAEDVSMSTADMVYINMETSHVTGLPEYMGGMGDPSPVTAYGTYVGMKAAAKRVYGADSLEGKKVLVQGVGNVGQYLVDHLTKENAKVFVSDINEEKLNEVNKKYGAEIIAPKDVYSFDMDIYAPCALGATLNDDTIPQLKCQIVAGAANNQLKDENVHGAELIKRGIVYAPDFLINAGGVINVYMEYAKSGHSKMAYEQSDKIYDTLLEALDRAERENITPQEAAMKMAVDRIEKIGKVKLSY